MSEKMKVKTLKPIFFGLGDDDKVAIFATNQQRNYSTQPLHLMLRSYLEDFLVINDSGMKIVPCITTDGKHHGMVIQDQNIFGGNYSGVGEDVPSTVLDERGMDPSPKLLPGSEQYQNFYDFFVSMVTLSNNKTGGFFSRPSTLRQYGIATKTSGTTQEDVWAYAGGTPEQGVPFFGEGGGIIIREGSENNPQYALYHNKDFQEHNITIKNEKRFPIFNVDITGAQETPPVSYTVQNQGDTKKCSIKNLSPVPIKLSEGGIAPQKTGTKIVHGFLDPYGGTKFTLTIEFQYGFRSGSVDL